MKTEYEKCLAGEPFIGSKDPKIMEMILRTRRLLAQFNAADEHADRGGAGITVVTLRMD